MRRLPQNLSLMFVSLAAVTGLAVAPVFAQSGSNDGGTGSGTTTTVSSEGSTSLSTDSGSTSSSGSVSTTEDSGTPTGGGRGPGGMHTQFGSNSNSGSNHIDGSSSETESFDTGSLHAEAAKLLAQDRQNKKASTVEHRQKACDAHQAELTNREANYAKAAQNHYDTFTSIYTKVLAFQNSKQLSVSNFDQLKAAVDAKQAAAQTAVSALASSDIKIDCTSTDPASAVAALKTAVSNARTALQDYRTAIKNLVIALQGASSSTDKTTTTPTPTESAQ